MTKTAFWLFCPCGLRRLRGSVSNAPRLVELEGSHPVFEAQMKTPPFRGACIWMAEKEGFEPSIRY